MIFSLQSIKWSFHHTAGVYCILLKHSLTAIVLNLYTPVYNNKKNYTAWHPRCCELEILFRISRVFSFLRLIKYFLSYLRLIWYNYILLYFHMGWRQYDISLDQVILSWHSVLYNTVCWVLYMSLWYSQRNKGTKSVVHWVLIHE